MKKHICSMLLACAMLLALLPTFAFAAGTDTNTATITAFAEGGAQVGTTYATIDSAAAAAGVGGTVRISAGDYYFNARQTISVAGVTLEGAGKDATKLYASSSFASASATNKKALLCIAADGVTVKDLTLDGSPYGDSIAQSEDFVVLRNNSGTGIELNNIMVEGSKRTLITVGMSSTSASVTGTNLYCQAEAKTLDSSSTYADVNVVNGTFDFESGVMDGFIYCESNGSFVSNDDEPLFTVTYVKYLFFSRQLTATLAHFADTYVDLKAQVGSLGDDYAKSVSNTRNQTVVANMVTRAKAIATTQTSSVRNFVTLLTDARAYASSSYASTLDTYISEINAVLPTA